MAKHTQRVLGRVAEMVDELVDQTIDLLAHNTRNPDQLVLNVTREQALRGLQQIVHDELASPQVSGERVWRLVSSILATVVSYLVDTMSESLPYVLAASNRAQSLHGCSRLPQQLEFNEQWV